MSISGGERDLRRLLGIHVGISIRLRLGGVRLKYMMTALMKRAANIVLLGCGISLLMMLGILVMCMMGRRSEICSYHFVRRGSLDGVQVRMLGGRWR